MTWEGIRDASQFGNTCPQGGEVGRRTGSDGELLPHGEDCLVLNVWTPGLDESRAPVMVWFHGRGFYGVPAPSRFTTALGWPSAATSSW